MEMPENLGKVYSLASELFNEAVDDGIKMRDEEDRLKGTLEMLKTGEISPETPLKSSTYKTERDCLKDTVMVARHYAESVLKEYPDSTSVKTVAERMYRLCDEIEALISPKTKPSP
ncbi:MAG: hypothetical protein NT120_04215 [Candidatus Aenigmarchaeota archaeon]|nr:hypothetical protein [Candidatus Aenigmarchaeota archaeon]